MGEPARNRKSARNALRSRLDPYVREIFESPPPTTPGYRLNPVDQFAGFLKFYATLLHLEEDDKALSALMDEAERTMIHPKEIFTFLPNNRGDRSQTLGSASANAIVRLFRETGWEAVRKHVSGMDGATAYSALAEATSQLTFPEWVDFCGKSLDLRNDPTGPGSSGWERFCAFPPSSFLTKARNLKKRRTDRAFRFGVRRHRDPSGTCGVLRPRAAHHDPELCESRGLRLQLPPLTRRKGIAPISPVILRDFDIACNTAASVIEARHFDALQSKEVPLAQRWIGSAFFQISSADRTIFYPRIADWPVEFRQLSELGTDVLIDGVDQNLPFVASLGSRSWQPRFDPRHGNLTVVYFSTLYRIDKTSQKGRAAKLTAHSRLVGLLRNHPNPNLLLDQIYGLALEMNDQPLAVDLFTQAEAALSFEEKVRWLSKGKFHAPMANLFSRHWPRIGGLSLGFSSFAQGKSSTPSSPRCRTTRISVVSSARLCSITACQRAW